MEGENRLRGDPAARSRSPCGGGGSWAEACLGERRGETSRPPQSCVGGDSGVMELALRHRGDAFRVVYALQIDNDIWVVHAFQKKSKSGIKTPKQDIDLIHERLKRLKEMLK